MNNITDIIGSRQTVDKNFRDMSSLFYKHVFIPSFARDIVMFGKENGEAIVEHYGLTTADLATIVETPLFKTEVRNLRKQLDTSVFATMQLRAAAALEGVVDVLAGQLTEPGIKPGDVVKISAELRALALMSNQSVGSRFAEGDEPKSSAGMTIAFSFGDPSKLPEIRPMVDVTPSPAQIASPVVEEAQYEFI